MKKILSILLLCFLFPSIASAWPTFGGSFLGLSDSPDSYSGQDGKCVAVKSSEDGLEFIACAAGGGSGDVTSAGDCASGACYDGTSDGGTYIRLYDGDSNYGAIVTTNLSANRTYTLPNFDATFASLAGAETLTNKTLAAADNVIEADSGDSATSFFSSGTLEDARLPSSMADKVITGSLAVPQGASPTVDAAGESAVDTTDDQFQYYGGAKRVLPYTYERCFTVQTPTGTDDNVPFFSPVDAITVTGVYCRTQGGTSVGITISDGTNAFEEVVCDSDGQADDGSITNATFTANERMEFDTGTVTGTVDWLNVCLRYSVDPS